MYSDLICENKCSKHNLWREPNTFKNQPRLSPTMLMKSEQCTNKWQILQTVSIRVESACFAICVLCNLWINVICWCCGWSHFGAVKMCQVSTNKIQHTLFAFQLGKDWFGTRYETRSYTWIIHGLYILIL